MVSLTFVFLFPWCSHSEWTIERHHFEAEYRESLETIDDDLVVLLERLDGLFAAVVSWTVYVFVRFPLTGTRHCVPPDRGRQSGSERVPDHEPLAEPHQVAAQVRGRSAVCEAPPTARWHTP
jgi:hypothetical protein